MKNSKKAKQAKKQNICKVPKEMFPSKAAFEALGLTFENIDDDILCQATLPTGWKFKQSGLFYAYLIDEKGRRRVIVYYSNINGNRKGAMYFHRRFYIHEKFINRTQRTVTIWDETIHNDSIFTAGTCEKEDASEITRLRFLAEAFLNKEYPEWREPSKYLD